MKTTLKQISLIMLLFLASMELLPAQTMVTVNASDANIQYTGRINNTDPNNVIFAFPGVSIKAKFQGTAINALFTEYGSGGGSTTNYINVIIDGGTPTSLKLTSAQTTYALATGLTDATHTIELFKRTESSVGKVAFKGFQLVLGKTLVTPDPLPSKRIEFIGNSITCGYGNESSSNPPVNGFTSVNENNYKAWGAVTARNLGAQYMCTAYSGRGLYRNNSGSQTGTLPLIYDQVIADDPSVTYDHTKFTPDVIVINLGTNDFAAEVSSAAWAVTEATFGATYKSFLAKLRGYYPNATFVCCVGVMMSDYYPSGGQHWTRIQSYVSNVVSQVNATGDNKVFYYMMDPQSPPYGEDWHPTAATDAAMATGLTAFINSKVTWSTCTGSVNLGSDISINGKTYPITLNSQSAANTGVTYKWYKDNVLISNATTPTYQITSSTNAVGTYKVVRDSASCSVNDQVDVSNTLLPVGKITNWDWNKKAAAALTFDDFSAGHFPIVVPELKARKINGTFFVNSGNMSSWTNVVLTAADGNEIANHTKTHVYANSSNWATEVLGNKNTIESNVTTQKVTTFAYPFGSYDDALIAYLISTGHIGARGVYPTSGNYTYNFATKISDYFKLLTFSMDATVTTAAYTTQIQNTINGGGFISFLYHSVNSPTVVDNNYATIPQSSLQAQLDALVGLKGSVWITTFSNAIKYHREKNCASLLEMQAPDGSQWILKLTDTIADNTTFNQPLYCQLKTNGVKYDQITQNGNPITIDYNANDSIMFHAIPDGGTIILKASAGISLSASVTPSAITNTATSVKFTATASATLPNTISSVTLNLTALGGGAAVAMTSLGGNAYEYTMSIAAGLSLGVKSIEVKASDNAAHSTTTTVSVEVGGGIVISSSSVTPNVVVNNVANTLAFKVNASDDGSVASVKLDLSSIGGGAAVTMTSAGSNNYTYSYILSANAAAGTKSIVATVTDNVGNTKTTTIAFTVNSSVTYTDIYTDASSMICSNCFWVGNASDAFVEKSNAGAIEGVKDYTYSYTIVGYWAGMGMNLTSWSDANAKDFSGFDSLELSYKGPLVAGTGFSVSLIGLANAKSAMKALTTSSTYKTVRIGLKEFGTFDLTKITQIGIEITGAASGSGTLQLDNIRLTKAGSGVITSIVNTNNTTKMGAIAYPNPFTDVINLRVNDSENSIVQIKVMNMYGSVVYESLNEKTNETFQFGSDLSVGVYIVTATVNNKIQIIKVIKQ